MPLDEPRLDEQDLAQPDASERRSSDPYLANTLKLSPEWFVRDEILNPSRANWL